MSWKFVTLSIGLTLLTKVFLGENKKTTKKKEGMGRKLVIWDPKKYLSTTVVVCAEVWQMHIYKRLQGITKLTPGTLTVPENS